MMSLTKIVVLVDENHTKGYKVIYSEEKKNEIVDFQIFKSIHDCLTYLLANGIDEITNEVVITKDGATFSQKENENRL